MTAFYTELSNVNARLIFLDREKSYKSRHQPQSSVSVRLRFECVRSRLRGGCTSRLREASTLIPTLMWVHIELRSPGHGVVHNTHKTAIRFLPTSAAYYLFVQYHTLSGLLAHASQKNSLDARCFRRDCCHPVHRYIISLRE
eukprot:Blabericola_migrator_1__5473@NODE_2798_length_2341_cov_476_891381_g1754_i0_p2_GENE_NODE_2798_length_2341_cov_476_891381_g1754_i0NODE_2798_length_2341_cov_476_891381_g1754_i0_p2_ORF_typecomplete_len142_score0_97_NODE_2798_length_2341_cov_476_891381_g1754_i09231348